jgi:hypothetical protein
MDTGLTLEQLQQARTTIGDLFIAGVLSKSTWTFAIRQIDSAVTALVTDGEPGWVFSHGRVREVRQDA